MASRRRKNLEAGAPVVIEPIPTPAPTTSKPTPASTPTPKPTSKPAPTQKFKIGSIVYINKDADADLNGFKLFLPYKKYTYTVESYDNGVYTLRRLNLVLKLKESDIISPEDRAHDSLNRKQF